MSHFRPTARRSLLFGPAKTTDRDFDLYVKIIGAGEPLHLTNTPGWAAEMSPAWSPDGRYIAFYRGRGEGLGFYLIPALGSGAERKLADASVIGGPSGAVPEAIDWASDGKTLVIVDKVSEDGLPSIFLLAVDTGERRRLTEPPPGSGDSTVSFSPDGSQVAFVRRYDVAEGDVYTVPVAGGEPTASPRTVPASTAWRGRRTGRASFSLLNTTGGNPTLWRVSSKGGQPSPSRVSGLTLPSCLQHVRAAEWPIRKDRSIRIFIGST